MKAIQSRNPKLLDNLMLLSKHMGGVALQKYSEIKTKTTIIIITQ